jgi:hypothetical protein
VHLAALDSPRISRARDFGLPCEQGTRGPVPHHAEWTPAGALAVPGFGICDERIRRCHDIIAVETAVETERAARAPDATRTRFMVFERYRAGNPTAVGARFREKGHMLPEGVTRVASWLSPAGDTCWQLVDAPDRAALDPWLRAWEDLLESEVTTALPSEEFWARRGWRGRPGSRHLGGAWW